MIDLSALSCTLSSGFSNILSNLTSVAILQFNVASKMGIPQVFWAVLGSTVQLTTSPTPIRFMTIVIDSTPRSHAILGISPIILVLTRRCHNILRCFPIPFLRPQSLESFVRTPAVVRKYISIFVGRD